MYAMQTSTPNTEPAQAAFAEGLAMSALPADIRLGAVRPVQNRLDSMPFHHGRYTPAIGSAGARMM